MDKQSERQLRYFDKYMCGMLPGCDTYDFTNKAYCTRQHMAYMLNRTQSMFKWEGLPDTIPQRVLELYLQVNGNTCFYKYEDDLYVFVGGLGGVPDVYYMPTMYIIANPALKKSFNLKIGEDCVVMPNDSLYLGLMPLFSRYASALTENELSLNIASINSRIIDLISAPDDRTRASAEKYLEEIAQGKQGIIAENAFLEGIRVQPYGSTANSNLMTNLIETEQYLKASWFNELGINANYNMKRESLNTTESQMNNDALLPLVDNMLTCRQIHAEEVNRMYGTNISVSLDSSWEEVAEEISSQSETGDINEEEEEVDIFE